MDGRCALVGVLKSMEAGHWVGEDEFEIQVQLALLVPYHSHANVTAVGPPVIRFPDTCADG